MNERPLSVWGWGYADRFPDRNERRDWLDRLSQLMDTDQLDVADPPEPDDLELPDGRLETPDSLSSILSGSPRDRASHTYGKAYRDLVRGFRGHFTPAPDRVARPRCEQDVRDVLDWADRHDVAVIPFGGGTSVVGGVEADFERERYRGVVSLDMRSLNRVQDVDSGSRLARIEAGATGPRLERQLDEHGFTLRHYPQSYEFSTLGGWIATRSSGHYATVETRIDDMVRSTRTLTPSGLLETAEVPASGAGPSNDALICGSEGTLGVITRSTMRVRRPPRFRSKASVVFDTLDTAVEATRCLAQSRLFPVNCRLLDEGEVMLNRITESGGDVLLLGFESDEYSTRPDLDRALELVREYGGDVLDEPTHQTPEDTGSGSSDSAGRWRSSFFDAPYLFNVLVSLGVVVDTFETACSWSDFPDLDHAVRRDVGTALEKTCGSGLLTMRFTHVYPEGPAPYYTFLGPGRRGSEIEQWWTVKQAASEAIRRHGGTITHHHAVGRVHRPWYEEEVSSLYRASLKSVKETLDPGGILIRASYWIPGTRPTSINEPPSRNISGPGRPSWPESKTSRPQVRTNPGWIPA